MRNFPPGSQGNKMAHRLNCPKPLALLILLAVIAAIGCSTHSKAVSSGIRIDTPKPQYATDYPACQSYGDPVQVGVVENPKLVEISGIAVSRKNPGVIWAINDSGNSTEVFAMTFEGRDLGSVRLTGSAHNLDWEDLALGPCGEDQCIYIPDVGDNFGSRRTKIVYRVVEPKVDPARGIGRADDDTWEAFEFRYPDGRHNCEAMVVHPNGDFYLVTKFKPEGRAGFYRLHRPLPRSAATLERLGTFEWTLGGKPQKFTAADVHPNGDRLLIRTYDGAFERRIEHGDPFEAMLAYDFVSVPAATEPQGEAVAYDPGSGGYFHISEQPLGNPPIFFVGCKSK
jgi:hypothetical protein